MGDAGRHDDGHSVQPRPGLPSAAGRKDWLPADDVAHIVVAAVERVPLGAFAVRPIPGGKA